MIDLVSRHIFNSFTYKYNTNVYVTVCRSITIKEHRFFSYYYVNLFKLEHKFDLHNIIYVYIIILHRIFSKLKTSAYSKNLTAMLYYYYMCLWFENKKNSRLPSTLL